MRRRNEGRDERGRRDLDVDRIDVRKPRAVELSPEPVVGEAPALGGGAYREDDRTPAAAQPRQHCGQRLGPGIVGEIRA